MTAPAWLTGKIAKVIALALLVAAIAYGLTTVIGWRRAAIENAATVGQQTEKIETTTEIAADSRVAEGEAARIQIDVTGAAQAFQDELERAKRNEPQTRANADTANPRSVLDAARKRRIARERSAGVADEP